MTLKKIKDFTEIWNASDSPAEAAQQLGISIKESYAYASKLRREGSQLKRFKNTLNIPDNEFIAAYNDHSRSAASLAVEWGVSTVIISRRAAELKASGREIVTRVGRPSSGPVSRRRLDGGPYNQRFVAYLNRQEANRLREILHGRTLGEWIRNQL